MTLTEFLLARIAEDEAAAVKASADSANWVFSESENYTWDVRTAGLIGSPGYEFQESITFDREGLSDSVSKDAGPHIARHDPARVLAECEAKRRIVKESHRVAVATHSAMGPLSDLADHVLTALALPYADHPDYRPEWKP